MDEGTRREDGYRYRLVNIDCLRDSTRFNVVMELDASIEPLLPYLAAILPGCSYTHGTAVIGLMDGGHIVGIHPTQITLTDVCGWDEAADHCARYAEKIREARAGRDRIQPVFEQRPDLTVMDILRRFPRTNCKACNAPTCLAFAARVFRREAPISACPPFRENLGEHADFLSRLRANGYEVPEPASPRECDG